MIRLKHKQLFEFLEGLLDSGSHQVGGDHSTGKPIQLVGDQDCLRDSPFAFFEELDTYEFDLIQSRPDDYLLAEENSCPGISLEALSAIIGTPSTRKQWKATRPTNPICSLPNPRRKPRQLTLLRFSNSRAISHFLLSLASWIGLGRCPGPTPLGRLLETEMAKSTKPQRPFVHW